MVEENTWSNIAYDVEGLGSTAEQRRLKCRRTLVGRMPVYCVTAALTYHTKPIHTKPNIKKCQVYL